LLSCKYFFDQILISLLEVKLMFVKFKPELGQYIWPDGHMLKNLFEEKTVLL